MSIVLATRKSARRATKKLVAARRRATRGILLYRKNIILQLLIHIMVAIPSGISTWILLPNLVSPQGIWLNSGIKGGSFAKESNTKRHRKNKRIKAQRVLAKIILSVASCLIDVFINNCIVEHNTLYVSRESERNW